MRHIFSPQPPNLPKRWIKLYPGRFSGLMALAHQSQRSKYLGDKNSWTVLKVWLSSFSHDKCWYCEAKSIRATFDVDHFRPKLRITVDGAELDGHTGYYWLAYEWWNLRLSCQRCNRPEDSYGKRNEFPIKDEAQRCSVPTGLLQSEEPRLLDPCCADDCKLLGHAISGEVFPNAEKGTWEYVRADFTRKQLGFNAFGTPEFKRSSWARIDLLIRFGGDRPEIVSELRKYLSPEAEYSEFFRSAIGSHRDKPWIEALLAA